MDALVRVSAYFSCIDEAKGPPRLEPLVEQIAYEPFAQLDVDRLVEPYLRHIQDQKGPGNDAKDHELEKESRQVFLRHRIIEWLVPGVELDLSEGRSTDDGEEGEAKQ